MFKPKAKLFAKQVPTIKDPNKPGPRVNAMAVKSFLSIPASFMAASTTGIMFCWWALDASSGTTPPNFSCTA